MKKLSFCLTLLFLLSTLLPVNAQVQVRNSSVTGRCYAGTKITRLYIPPPKEYFNKVRSKSGGSIVVYYSGFTPQAKAAVEYAASILRTLLPADTKFTVNASWESISTSGVLAQSTITNYIGGSVIDAQNPVSYYPIALAEKIAGKSFNEDLQGDITLAVNSSINWYLGTDGQTPVTKYDLVTVALHEMCHGLGFFDSFGSDGTTGSFGINSIPFIYDTFVENFNGDKLTDTLKFLNFSSSLKAQLTGNQVYFNGPLLKNYTSSNPSRYTVFRARLYAPTTWDAGSSISHLNETSVLPADALMTPFIDLGEAIHDPGQYTFSILADLGWINTKIIHTPSGDTESHLTQVTLEADIKSDTTYNHSSVGVAYSFDNFLTVDTSYLTSPGANNSYVTSIPISSYNSGLQYYFFVQDYFLRTYRSPSLYKDYSQIKNNRYHIYIGMDTVKPVIVHTPVAYYFQTVDSLKFKSTVTDNLGVDSAYVEFKVNNGPSRFIRLQRGASDNYSTAFNAKSLFLKGHDSIQYKIFAVDTAHVPNITSLPKSGFFVSRIEEIYTDIKTNYSTDFSGAAPDFFNTGFDISRPSGFSKFGLNSQHPYASPDDNNKTFDFTAVLRQPFKFNESGITFSFNEIVLVEPGAAGTVFGSSDFFDYVIIEGSKNFGKTWFSLLDGYDCRLYNSWEAAYNSSINGDNSTFIATESMLRKHSFLYHPSANITAGDTLLVRFRLFSDPFANGWGWVLEDLKISPLIDAVAETINHPVNIYPNPGRGILNLTSESPGAVSSKPLHYKIYNTSGVCLKDSETSGYTETLCDISSYPAGLYIIVLYLDDGIKTIKYSLIK